MYWFWPGLPQLPPGLEHELPSVATGHALLIPHIADQPVVTPSEPYSCQITDVAGAFVDLRADLDMLPANTIRPGFTLAIEDGTTTFTIEDGADNADHEPPWPTQ